MGEFSIRFYLIKSPAMDIKMHNARMLLLLPIIWFTNSILDICLMITLFHESIVIYLSLFRMYQFYKKQIPAWMHWLGTALTFMRLCVSFYSPYYYHLYYSFHLSME